MTKALEQILSREFEARDARLRESQPQRDKIIDSEAKRHIAKYGGTIDGYKERDSYHIKRRDERAYRHETEIAIANAIGRYLDKNAYVVSSEVQHTIDKLCTGESSKTWKAARCPDCPMKYRTKEAELANQSRNPYLRNCEEFNYLFLAEAVRLAVRLGKNVEVNIKGNQNDSIFFKDRKKMLQKLKSHTRLASKKVKIQFDLS